MFIPFTFRDVKRIRNNNVKDLKEDLSQAVSELVPGDDIITEESEVKNEKDSFDEDTKRYCKLLL